MKKNISYYLGVKERVLPFAAKTILNHLPSGKASVLGTCTGSTPIPLMKYLAAALKERNSDYRSLRVEALDSWGFEGQQALGIDDPRSFESFNKQHWSAVFEPYGFQHSNSVFPGDASAGKTLKAGQQFPDYDRDMLPVSIWVAGIGSGTGISPEEQAQAHIAFCEPGYGSESEWLEMPTFCVPLCEQTRAMNIDYPGCNHDLERVPNIGITVSCGTLLHKVHDTLMLMAFGEHKAYGLAAALEGPIGPHCPASVVQIIAESREVVVIADAEAAQFLEKKERIATIV